MESVYEEYQNRNQYLIEYLEKSYQDQLIKYNNLDKLIHEKEKENEIQELRDLNFFERQRSFYFEETQLNSKIKSLETEEINLENSRLHQLSLSSHIDSQIDDLYKENQNIILQIKNIHNLKQNFQIKKKKYFEQFSNQLTKLKTKHKGELLVTEERAKHLNNIKNDLDTDYLNFQSQWNLYLEKVNDRKEEISEMISILEEELKNKNMKQQLERKKTVTLNRKWLEESKRNKTQTQLWLQENNTIQENILILKSQEEQWLLNLKNNNNLSINELQTNLNNLEQQLKNKNIRIQNTKDLIENKTNLNINLNDYRKTLGELVQEKVLIDDAYNIALLDLNKFYKQSEETLKSNPFAIEIKKHQDKINKNLLSIEKIKKRETIIINQNKLYLKTMRSHLEKIRDDIKGNYLELEKLNKTFINQEKRHTEELSIYQNKFNKYYQSYNQDNQYLEDLSQQQQKEIDELKNLHNISIETIDFSIWDCQDQIDNLRLKSNTILLEIDQLNYRKTNLGYNEKIALENVQKEKQTLSLTLTNLQNDFNKYHENIQFIIDNKPDFQIETYNEIQNLLKIKNDVEKELKLLYFEIESAKSDIRKSFDYQVSLRKIINQEIQKKIDSQLSIY